MNKCIKNPVNHLEKKNGRIVKINKITKRHNLNIKEFKSKIIWKMSSKRDKNNNTKRTEITINSKK